MGDRKRLQGEVSRGPRDRLMGIPSPSVRACFPLLTTIWLVLALSSCAVDDMGALLAPVP